MHIHVSSHTAGFRQGGHLQVHYPDIKGACDLDRRVINLGQCTVIQHPLDIAIDYAQSKGIEFTEEMQDMFKEVLAQVAREEM